MFANFKTWHDAGNPEIAEFPFLYYTAIDTNYNVSKVFLIGGDAIVNSNLAELNKL